MENVIIKEEELDRDELIEKHLNLALDSQKFNNLTSYTETINFMRKHVIATILIFKGDIRAYKRHCKEDK